MMGQSQKKVDLPKEEPSPLQPLFDDYQDAISIQPSTPLHMKVRKVDKEADLRATWLSVIKSLPQDDLEFVLFSQKLSDGKAIKNTAIEYNLLPEAYKISPKIRSTPIELNIGNLAQLPYEIRTEIFQLLSFADVSASASVSKSWFHITSSKDLWAPRVKATIGDLDPFTSFQHDIINKRIWKHKDHYIYATDVEVTNGKGLLVCEEGYLQGIKLNGVPIISAWNGELGFMARCMVRSKFLTKEEISPLTKDIDKFLNEGTIDFLTLDDTLTPFMNFLANGRYRIRIQSNLFCWLVQYQSNTDLRDLEGGPESDEESIYCLIPSNKLSLDRIKFYEDQIKQSKRLVVLAIKGAYDYFLLDGHHKIKAYYNMNREREMIVITVEALDPIPITRQEELAYIQHSARGVESLIEGEKKEEKRRLKRAQKLSQ